MYRTGALLNSIFTALRYRQGGNLVLKTPFRLATVAASANAPIPGTPAESHQSTDPTGAPLDRPVSRQLRFGTLQFLLQRKMPINSMRLLASGVRMACDEKRAEDMIPFLGSWLSQVTRPDNLERLMPWTITDILRDLNRLARTAGVRTVRDALPPKHLQTLANRLVVQGFDKLTPLQLARAAEAFATLRPWLARSVFEQAATDVGAEAGTVPAATVWPTSDWVDELVDWLHNLKPNVEPWPRTSCYILSVILNGLARSNYKPRQPTFQAVATAMKAKLEEQLKSGYLSRSALANSAIAWNIWRTNPEEYAAGYWDTYLKSAAQVMEEYVDTAPDPPSIEDDTIVESPEAAGEEGEDEKIPRRRARPTQSLLSKRREFRSLLATVVMAAKHFNLSKQFDEIVKPVWEKRLDEHAPFISGVNARRILNVTENLGITLKAQTQEKLTTAGAQFRASQGGGQDRDVDDFDDLRGTTTRRSGDATGSGRTPGVTRGAGRNEAFDDYDDFNAGGGSMTTGRIQRTDRGSTRKRRDDDLDFDDKPF